MWAIVCTGALTSGAAAPRDMLSGFDVEELEGFMVGNIGDW